MDVADVGMRWMRQTWGRDGCSGHGDMVDTLDVADAGTWWMWGGGKEPWVVFKSHSIEQYQFFLTETGVK
jgi:hypothetical protein